MTLRTHVRPGQKWFLTCAAKKCVEEDQYVCIGSVTGQGSRPRRGLCFVIMCGTFDVLDGQY